MSSQRRNHRLILAVALFVPASLAVPGRLVYLQAHDHEFLADQGGLRSIRDLPIPVTRDMVTDRNGGPLVVSTEVASIWHNSREMADYPDEVPRLIGALHHLVVPLLAQLQTNPNKRFLYLERSLSPIEASEVMTLGITGVHQIKEYKRSCPNPELITQLTGLANVDDRDQEGIEPDFNDRLSDKDGGREVAVDPHGSLVNSIKVLKTPKVSQDVALSINPQPQFITYKAPEKAVLKFGTHSDSTILVDPKNGQILAMANFPPYNLNNRTSFVPTFMRDHTLTGIFESGSVIKPFSTSAALAPGRFDENGQVSVAPGWMATDGHTIHDVIRRNVPTMTEVLINSSNIGMSKVALQIRPQPILEQLGQVGFDVSPSLGFPDENPGYLSFHEKWSNIATASMSFGYSLTMNAAEPAQVHSAFANSGKLVPFSLFRDSPQNQACQTTDPQIARRIQAILQTVVEDPKGMARARMPSYHATGKSGTVHKASGRDYADRFYRSLFVGMAPASDPQLVLTVMIDSPTRIGYFGGLVSIPVFNNIMAGSLHALAIPPNNLQDNPAVANRQYHG